MSEVKDYEKQCEILTKAFKHLYKAQAVLGEYNEMYLSELKYSDGTFAEQAINDIERILRQIARVIDICIPKEEA